MPTTAGALAPVDPVPTGVSAAPEGVAAPAANARPESPVAEFASSNTTSAAPSGMRPIDGFVCMPAVFVFTVTASPAGTRAWSRKRTWMSPIVDWNAPYATPNRPPPAAIDATA